MKKILFVIAMEKEAIDITKELELIKIENEKNLKIFRKNNISLLITGIGKELTAINLTQYLENNEKPDIIINLGYAGTVKSKIGEWVNVAESYNYEWNIPGEQKYTIEGYDKNCIKKLENNEIKKLPCYSAECFVTKTEITDDAVFDMELHSIYLICNIYNIELVSLKKISDTLSLDEYYKNLNMKEVFEIKSGLEYLKKLLVEVEKN